jgi:hypothetical protein
MFRGERNDEIDTPSPYRWLSVGPPTSTTKAARCRSDHQQEKREAMSDRTWLSEKAENLIYDLGCRDSCMGWVNEKAEMLQQKLTAAEASLSGAQEQNEARWIIWGEKVGQLEQQLSAADEQVAQQAATINQMGAAIEYAFGSAIHLFQTDETRDYCQCGYYKTHPIHTLASVRTEEA